MNALSEIKGKVLWYDAENSVIHLCYDACTLEVRASIFIPVDTKTLREYDSTAFKKEGEYNYLDLYNHVVIITNQREESCPTN